MADATPRFVPAGEGAVLDRETGLLWERSPSPRPVPWADAARRPEGVPWRLPTAIELLLMLNGLRGAHPFPDPAAGPPFWSCTVSPYSAHGQVRAVGRAAGPVWVVRLLDRAAEARAWRVRAF